MLTADARIRPGITAEVSLLLGGEDEEDHGFLVPLEALAPRAGEPGSYVFRFDLQPYKKVVRGLIPQKLLKR